MGSTSAAQSGNSRPEDPFLWLEDVDGEQALDWVRARNRDSLRVLEATPGFDEQRLKAEAWLTEKRAIAWPRLVEDDRASANSGLFGETVVNFWQDDEHPRGVWRQASLKHYLAGRPDWSLLLDLDALNREENANWVWKGATCLEPARTRCLVKLSNGGKDATVIREYDRVSRQFVRDGFSLAESKSAVAWIDADTLLVGASSGKASQTTSGYPRQIRLWRRGERLAAAPLLFEAAASDVGVQPLTSIEAGGPLRAVYRAITFWTGELYHFPADAAPVKGPLPADADIQALHRGRVFALLRTPLTTGRLRLPAGALVSYQVAPLLAGKTPAVELVYAPSPGVAIQKVVTAGPRLLVSVLSNVSGTLLSIRESNGRWPRQIVALPGKSTVIPLAGSDDGNLAFVKVTGFTEPARLYAVSGRNARIVAANPARFNPARFVVRQDSARSSDGTRIPYFVVRSRTARGPVPTLLYAYGGFEVPMLPDYVTPEVQLWLEQGGAYVLANLRGGGEFGPAWHQAGLRERRQTVFDDLYAVARSLVTTRVTTPRQLGLHGRSNGGLLVATALTQAPQLFRAAMIGVPLTDMARYTKLLAGASWVDEYGDPDTDADWAYLRRWSPYQNLRAGQPYPAPFIYTSTRDDRVHPGHARKFAARLESLGYRYFYYENLDGGHAGVSSPKEQAYRMALMLAYLNFELKNIGKRAILDNKNGGPR